MKDFGYKIILASQSPRRRDLLRGLDIDFVQEVRSVEESVPESVLPMQVPLYLAILKSKPFIETIDDKTLVITADTVVVVDDLVLGKPKNYDDAFRMLSLLSGKKHKVVTGVCLSTKEKTKSFSSISDVYFKKLTDSDIKYYLDNYKPYDKAGAYGIQEWIGYVAIERVDGSFYNVMGLPVHLLYQELCNF